MRYNLLSQICVALSTIQLRECQQVLRCPSLEYPLCLFYPTQRTSY